MGDDVAGGEAVGAAAVSVGAVMERGFFTAETRRKFKFIIATDKNQICTDKKCKLNLV